jgi:hypothetical protein
MSIESQRAGAALLESEEHYRAVADAATDAIITIDSDSTTLIVNPATERIFGYSSEEMIGQPLTMLMPEYLRHLHKAGITRYLETAGSIFSGQPFNCPVCIRPAMKFHLKSHSQNSPEMAGASSRESRHGLRGVGLAPPAGGERLRTATEISDQWTQYSSHHHHSPGGRQGSGRGGCSRCNCFS